MYTLVAQWIFGVARALSEVGLVWKNVRATVKHFAFTEQIQF